MNDVEPAAPAPVIDGARRADLAAIRWLLDRESLPSLDLTEDGLEHFLVYRDEKGVVGAVGLERYGEVALLRSLVVASEHMGRGLGKRLVAAAEELAAKLNVRSIYLLTTTEVVFFESRGFRRIRRDEAPLAIRSTGEFTSLCPASAVLMVKP